MNELPSTGGDALKRLLAARGYAVDGPAAQIAAAWREAAGTQLAQLSRPDNVPRAGLLWIWVSGSAVSQELRFQEARLLAALRASLPTIKLRGLRYRVGPVGRACYPSPDTG